MLKKKCTYCTRKSLCVEPCKCGKLFCLKCLPSFNHGCGFDWSGAKRRYLEESNPLVIAPKVQKI